MTWRRILVKFLYCLTFVSLVGIPLNSGFASQPDLYGAFRGTVLTTVALIVASLFRHSTRHETYSEAQLNGDLIYFVCISLCLLLPFPSDYTGYSYAFAFGLYGASTSGKVRADSPLYAFTTNYIFMAMVIALVFGLILRLWADQPITETRFLLNWFGPSLSCFAGQVFGLLLNRCVPPLIEVWHELKRLGRVLGGYALGYLFITIVFAGFYATLYRWKPASLDGPQPTFGFVDYWYFSIAVMTTVTDAKPTMLLAKCIVALEVLLGIGWTVVVFAALVTAFNKTPSSLVDNSFEEAEIPATSASSQE